MVLGDVEVVVLLGVVVLVIYCGWLLVEVLCGVMKCSDNVLICFVYL